MKPLFPILTLAFLSTLFGEYLLGNLKVSELGRLPLLACLYGTGALVIRETARRHGRGAGTMLTLAAAYALIEEGVVVQMLFNPALTPQGIGRLQTLIPGLGADLWVTMVVTFHHMVYSITLPILLTEALFGGAGPWLGKVGYRIALIGFALGAGLLTVLIWRASGFFAAPLQWGSCVGAAVLITLAGLRARPGAAHIRSVPPPWSLGLAAFAATTAYQLTGTLSGWSRVVACLLLAVAAALALGHLSRAQDWTAFHRMATIGGCLGTAFWLGFVVPPQSGPPDSMDTALRAMLVVGIFILWVVAWRRSRP